MTSRSRFSAAPERNSLPGRGHEPGQPQRRSNLRGRNQAFSKRAGQNEGSTGMIPEASEGENTPDIDELPIDELPEEESSEVLGGTGIDLVANPNSVMF